jgi:uncharacterized LabA/DUF88 family protein
MEQPVGNVAFIDGQNLYLGTHECGWAIDSRKFRTYLKDKYNVVEAYYFLGCIHGDEEELYANLQRAGFILSFREHSSGMKGHKKGNVDSDIVFNVMKMLVENEPFDKAIIVSGDGDYKKVVDFLIKRERFERMLLPNKKFASSLYKKLGGEYYSYLEEPDVRSKIEYRRKSL